MYLRRMKQKEVFPCVGGGVKMETQAIPPPPPRGGFSPKTGRIWSQPPSPTWHSRSHDMCGIGVKVAIFLQIPQLMGLARNLFSKMYAGNFYLPYCSVKICPPLSCELWERLFCIYSKSALYKLRRVKFSLSPRHSNPEATSPRRVVIKQEQSRPLQHTLDSELFVVFLPKVLLHTVYIFNIFTVDWG